MRFSILLASSMLAASAFAQTPGSCEVGTAQGILDISRVQASVYNNGNLFFGGSTTSGDGYLVPRNSNQSPLFVAGLWLGGTVEGDLRVSAARYGNYLFRPGPLNSDGTLPDPANCSAYDRIYVVSGPDLEAYEAGGTPTSDLADWPVGLGAPTVDINGDPVAVTSREQTIDLAAGERPDLYGSQMAFWVMNDVGAPRVPPAQTAPLGVEVQVSAFLIATDEEIKGAIDASFYRFTIINRSAKTIEDARGSWFSDPDLGGAGDDYVGTDTTRGMAFAYNSDDVDSAYGTPPAIGFDLLSGGLSATGTFIGGGPTGTADPATAEGYYNVMRGLWPGGAPITAMGQGYQSDGPITTYFYPGDPVTESFWSEVNNDGSGSESSFGDRRLVSSTTFGTLAPGDTAMMDVGVLFERGIDRFDSITKLREVSDAVQLAYDSGALFEPAGQNLRDLTAPNLLFPENEADLVLADTVTFAWEPVESAESYELRWVGGASGSLFVTDTTVSVNIRDTMTRRSGVHSVYWTVTARAQSAFAATSEQRSLSVYRGGVLRLNGQPAYIEVSGPDGEDPCGPNASSTGGCSESFGNPVYRSFNSTSTYYVTDAKDEEGSDASIGAYAPHDFEIRYTDTGSLAAYADQGGNIIRVPFEVWDVGPVTPGDANNPNDDRQLVPLLFADNGGTCAFDAAEIPDGEATFGGFVESDRISAHYPATAYASFEAAFQMLVEAEQDRCYQSDAQTIRSFLYPTQLAPPIQDFVFGSRESAPSLPATGTVIRLYTDDPPFEVPFPISVEAIPLSDELVLGAVYPNPAASSLTVPYSVAVAGEVELAVYDVLGRRVAALVNGRQLEGAHTAELDASALAPGVYVVRLRAGKETRTTRITVVR